MVALFVGGIGGCSGLAYSGVHHAIQAQRLEQSGLVSLHTGKYTVYSSGPTVAITSPAGEAVSLAGYHGTVHLTLDSTRYQAISTFTAQTEGSYRVVLSGAGSVAVGPGLGTDAAKIGGALAVGFVGVLAAAAVLTIVLVRRGSHKRRLAQGGYRQPGGYGYMAPNVAGTYPYQAYPSANQHYPPANQGYPPANQGYPQPSPSYPPPMQPGPPPQ
jgi:hypothetical protein